MKAPIKEAALFLAGIIMGGFGAGYIVLAMRSSANPIAYGPQLLIGMLTIGFLWEHARAMACGMLAAVAGIVIYTGLAPR